MPKGSAPVPAAACCPAMSATAIRCSSGSLRRSPKSPPTTGSSSTAICVAPPACARPSIGPRRCLPSSGTCLPAIGKVPRARIYDIVGHSEPRQRVLPSDSSKALRSVIFFLTPEWGRCSDSFENDPLSQSVCGARPLCPSRHHPHPPSYHHTPPHPHTDRSHLQTPP